MFNHGTSTSMLFLLVGVLYDRAHHREINRFGGLAQPLPVYAGVTTLALFASMGLPGLSGFISEFLVFLGSFRSGRGEYSRPGISFQSLTIVAALATALRMPPDAQRDRMRSMRAYLAEFNVYRWAGRMLVDAARLRRQERLAGRLQDGLLDSTAAL
jgi:NADH-quinone oxidoreductase subunit M